MAKEFDGKIVLITGSSRGIGAATAELVKSRGGKPTIHGRTRTKEMVDFANKLRAPSIDCDVTDRDAVFRMVGELVNYTKRIDVLINAAGIVKPQSFLETTEENFAEHFDVNLGGTVNFCEAVIPHMLDRGSGVIVNVASVRGLSEGVNPEAFAYSASKAAVIDFSSGLAELYAPVIRVNCVSPGFTQTDMSETWPQNIWDEIKASPLGRPARPEEVAESILFLASDRASLITGQNLVLDAGYLSFKR